MTDDAGRWASERALFEELVELDESARADRLASTDPELREAVRGLLALSVEAAGFLEQPPASLAGELLGEEGGADELPPQRIGAYRILERLGRGGMGDVFLAERADGQFEHRVALKLLKPGIDSEGIRRRFLQERQVLAHLDHPNVARILDGGEADGRPYFVMELVAGKPITDYCRDRNVSIRDRLALIATCAEAVTAAQRLLIVHRDIKPSNVLVNDAGQVKLLDFGIAKVLTDDGDAALFTRAEERVLTPTYAAPEQILGEPVTTATDVYALGAVLYELLTGAPPHERTSLSAAQLASRVELEAAQKPSRALLAAGTKDARRLARQLEGDVDAIVQKALRREPERRYAGAGEMAEDLRRYLRGDRVEARPDTVAYRAGKFVRRHRAGVAAAVLVILALLAGLATTAWQARVARANARRAERVQEFLIGIFQGSDPSEARGRKVTALELLAAGTRRIETDLRGEPEAQAALYDAVARIQCNLGELPEAQKLAERALAERRRLFGARDAQTMQSVVTLAVVRAALAEEKDAEKLVREALPVLRDAYGEDGDETIRARELLTDLLVNQGSNEEALQVAGDLVASSRRRFGADSPEAANNLHQVGMIQEGMSHYDQAEKTYRQVIAILDRAVGVEDPRASNAHATLAELLSYRGQRDEAEKEFAITLAAQKKSLGADHPDVAGTLIDLGFLYLNERRYVEADAAFEESLRIYRELGSVDAANTLRVWALSLLSQEKYAEAQKRIEECLAIARPRYGPKHQVTLTALGNLGEAQLRLGDRGAAEATLVEALGGLEEMFGKEADNLRGPLNNLGELRRLQGRTAEGLALHRRALAIQLKTVGPDNPSVPGTRLQIALDLLALEGVEQLAEARTQLDAAMAVTRRVDAGHPRLDEMLLASGRVARGQGDTERSRRDLGEAAQRLEQHHGSGDERTREARRALADASTPSR